jgi:RNA polymerase sigma factor (sigma-70 family)
MKYYTETTKKQVLDILSTLSTRDQKVIKMRFGFDDGCPLTLEEVGLYFNVTRERIRQIEVKALRLIRQRIGLTDFTPIQSRKAGK